VADRVVRHELATALAFILSAVFVTLLGFAGLPMAAVFLFMVRAGFFIAVAAPLRDVMVRQAAPRGSVGTAFGIVTTGFSVGFAVAPVLLGWVVDRGHPGVVFWAIAAFTLLGVCTLAGVRTARVAAQRAGP
jgi:MFS transporter, FSR family, fosmidomycin resistance protein